MNAGARFKTETAATKALAEADRYGEFQKAKVDELADAYRLEIGWVIVHSDHRRKGYAHRLVAAAVEAVPGQGMQATTKTDQMRKMLPEFGFAVRGEPYPAVLAPDIVLTLFGRSARGE